MQSNRNDGTINSTTRKNLQRTISLDRIITKIIDDQVWRKKLETSSSSAILLTLYRQNLLNKIKKHEHFPLFLIPNNNSTKETAQCLLRSIVFWSILNNNTISTQGYSQSKMSTAIQHLIDLFTNPFNDKFKEMCLELINDICEKYIYAYDFIPQENIAIFNKKINAVIKFIENEIFIADENHIRINGSSLTINASDNSNSSHRICDLINILHNEKSMAKKISYVQECCYEAALIGQENKLKDNKYELKKMIQEYLDDIGRLKEGKMSLGARLLWEPLLVQLGEKLQNVNNDNKINLYNLSLALNKNLIFPQNREQLSDFLVLKQEKNKNLNVSSFTKSKSLIETEFTKEMRSIIFDTLTQKEESDNQSIFKRHRKLIKLKTKLSNLSFWKIELESLQKSLIEVDSEKSLKQVEKSIHSIKKRIHSLQNKCDNPMGYYSKMLTLSDQRRIKLEEEKNSHDSPRINARK